ncbi:MAG TPA: hypothetical protein DET40_10095 [Lentisphaeria bacterium]|nr:MAG: hypothetical protein A2X45_21795 [Lentisphaerae bacterium GWF2_50_93]HCE43886.1 hypothetical protein [Lentisphaeria bacterium]
MILKALDLGGYKITEAHPMQCYSVYKGKASTWPLMINNPNPNGWNADIFSAFYKNLTGLSPIGMVTGSTESVLYYQVDWLGEWGKRAKKVNGYPGTNVLGFDF